MKPEKPSKNPADLVVSTQFLAGMYRVSKVTIGCWVQKGMPKRDRDRFSLAEVVQWRHARDLAAAEAKGGTLAAERRALIREQVRGYEMDNAATAAALLPAEDVARDIRAFQSIVETSLADLPDRVADAIPASGDAATAQQILKVECRRQRVVIAQAMQRYSDSLVLAPEQPPGRGNGAG